MVFGQKMPFPVLIIAGLVLAGGCIQSDDARNFTSIWVGVNYLSGNSSAPVSPPYEGYGYVMQLMRNGTSCWDMDRCWWESGTLTIELRDPSLEVIDTIKKKLRDRDRVVVKTASGGRRKMSMTPSFSYFPEGYNITDAKTFKATYVTRGGKIFKFWGTIVDTSR